MCTLSWKPFENSYVLFFNRDESRNRVAEVIARIEAMSLEHCPPFHLVVADTNQASVLTWSGSACHFVALNAHGVMLTTSAFRSIDVVKVRNETFSAMVGDIAEASTAQLKEFHWYKGDVGATGIQMSRPDACTHSISCITVSLSEKKARYHYSPQPEISSTGKPASYDLCLSDPGQFNAPPN